MRLFLTDDAGRTVSSGIDTTFDPRAWLAGTTYHVASAFPLPANLRPGTYGLRIALVDALGTPRVLLAVDGGDASLRYPLGQVRIAR